MILIMMLGYAPNTTPAAQQTATNSGKGERERMTKPLALALSSNVETQNDPK
jgi:hypothetical protein